MHGLAKGADDTHSSEVKGAHKGLVGHQRQSRNDRGGDGGAIRRAKFSFF
jgi:hypothetical protein